MVKIHILIYENHQEPPQYANGKICYIGLPSADIAISAAFYNAVFGWQTRRRSNGTTAFDDGVGEVSGTWVSVDLHLAGSGLGSWTKGNMF